MMDRFYDKGRMKNGCKFGLSGPHLKGQCPLLVGDDTPPHGSVDARHPRLLPECGRRVARAQDKFAPRFPPRVVPISLDSFSRKLGRVCTLGCRLLFQ